MDKYIYYIRDDRNRSMITICLIRDKDGMYARGIAICSLSETSPDKSVGRMYARGKAIRAFKKVKAGKEWQCSPINREEAYRSLMKANKPILSMETFQAKSVYSPKLNSLEKQFIAKWNPYLTAETG